MQTTEFSTDIKKGKVGEQIFKEDFLDFLKLKYEDVSGCQSFQIQGVDFCFPLGRVDIKNSYKSHDNTIIIEEYSDQTLKKKGWFDKSTAHLFIFVDPKTRHMVFVPNTKELHTWYNENKLRWDLCFNKVSYSKNGEWQSSFRVVGLDYIPHSFYYKGIIKTTTEKTNKRIVQLILEDSYHKNKGFVASA